MKAELCPCHAGTAWLPENMHKKWWKETSQHAYARDKNLKTGKYERTKLKPRRIRCPECGRRLMCVAKLNSDGDLILWRLPEHKPKEWYKKKKVKTKKQKVK